MPSITKKVTKTQPRLRARSRKKSIFIKLVGIFIIVLSICVTSWLVINPKKIENSKALSNINNGCPTNQFYFNGKCRDYKLFGQPDYQNTASDTISNLTLSHSSGVAVYKNPNGDDSLYVVDSGNNRILGFKSVNDSIPSIVIGQTSFNKGTCNGNNITGIYNKPSKDTLCLINYPDRTNVTEYWIRSNIFVNKEGNLYVVDPYNNRVLMYKDPFNTDTIPDKVWGQKDYVSNKPNRGGAISPKGINVSSNNNVVSVRGSVTVDSSGNLWVADIYNARVLRFPKACEGSSDCSADLVLGQSNFTSNNLSGCWQFNSLTSFCRPTIVKEDPEKGDIYVVDEFERNTSNKYAFESRILVFKKSSLANGVKANKEITISNPNFATWDDYGTSRNYLSQITGLEFNTFKKGAYSKGKMWINEHKLRRTVLVDANGVVIKSLRGSLNSRPELKYGDLDAGGSIGIDKNNNLYTSNEDGFIVKSYAISKIDFANQNPSFKTYFKESSLANSISLFGFAEHVGVVAFKNQLIIRDKGRLLVWNNYLTRKGVGEKADFSLYSGNDVSRNNDFLKTRSFNTIDDQNILWTRSGTNALAAFQLPLKPNDTAIKSNIDVYWAGTNQIIDFDANMDKGITFDPINRKLWIVDTKHSRILRISNYKDIKNSGSKMYADLVLGQPDKDSIGCNNNQSDAWIAATAPTASNMCRPTGIVFDRLGNLYVIDNDYECHGNNRITMFAKNDLAKANGMFPNLAAKKVFIRSSLTEKASCNYNWTGQPASPVSIAFNSKNQMFVGNDGYYSDQISRPYRQIWVYLDPLKKINSETYWQGQLPDTYVGIALGSVGELTFDEKDNLIVQDHTWPRALVLNLGTDSIQVTPTSLPTPYPTPVITPTVTPVIDKELPVVYIASPKNMDTIKGKITINTIATDNVSISSINIYIDSQKIHTCNIFSCIKEFDTTSIKNGEHTIKAEAFDATGNKGQTTTKIIVNNKLISVERLNLD